MGGAITSQTDASELLVVGPSWLGDAVMMGALIARLKADQPARRITVLTPPHLEGVVRRLPGVGATIVNPFGHGDLKLLQRWRFARALTDRFDAAIVLPHSLKSALIPFFAGVATRTGFIGESRYLLLNDARSLDEAALPRMVDRFCLLAEPPGAAAPRAPPRPTLTDDPERTRAVRARLGLSSARPAVALGVGAEYGPAKRWPARHFAALAQRLNHEGYDAWLLGGRPDGPIGAQIASFDAAAVNDLTGQTTLEDAVDLIAGAAAVVSNDSGLMHVAAALGRPLVALYGSSSPAFTPPLSDRAVILSEDIACSPCFERVCPLGHFKGLNDLDPERVWGALYPLLATPQ